MSPGFTPGRTVTVFGSGTVEPGSPDYELARRLGAGMARAGFRLCNGGYGGTMAAGAQGAKEAGGATVGVTLKGQRWQGPNPWLDEVVQKDHLLARLACLLDYGDGYVILAGGTGTLAEIGVLLEMMNKQVMSGKPAVFLGEFWSPLLTLLAWERILCEVGPFRCVRGVRMMGMVACTDSTEAAVRYLAANLPGKTNIDTDSR